MPAMGGGQDWLTMLFSGWAGAHSSGHQLRLARGGSTDAKASRLVPSS